MKKGKSRNKRKKTRSRLLWIVIAVIAIAAVISAVCVAGMLATKENAWRTPEELLVEYMDHIPKQEYEEMYAMLHIEASGNVSQEDFVTRNSAIYEGIEVQNMYDILYPKVNGQYCSKSMDTYRFQYDALYALDIVLQLGILEKREDLYVFSHQAYQDYYYAMEELAVIQS